MGEIFLFAAPLGLVALVAIALMREVPLGGKSGIDIARERATTTHDQGVTHERRHHRAGRPLGELQLHRLLVAIDGSDQRRTRRRAADHRRAPRQRSVTLLTVGPDLVGRAPPPGRVAVAGALDQDAVDEDGCKRL